LKDSSSPIVELLTRTAIQRRHKTLQIT